MSAACCGPNRGPDHHADRASTDEDKLGGLDLGADDYLTKPFNPRNWSPASVPCCAGPRRTKSQSRTCASAISPSALSGTRYFCRVDP